MEYINWKMSVDKWETIVSDFEIAIDEIKDGILLIDNFTINLFTSCGFCWEFVNIRLGTSFCRECPLFKEKICINTVDVDFLFWQIEKLYISNDLHGALKLSKQMLERIKKEPHNNEGDSNE